MTKVNIKVGCIRIILVIALLIPLVWTAVSTELGKGDLARIGKLSDKQFGPRHSDETPPSDIPVVQNLSQGKINNKVLSDALRDEILKYSDILVIGDSFSVDQVWQQTIHQRGGIVTTVEWSFFGGICSDISEVISSLGFTGRLIIIQSVERNLTQHVKQSINCLSSAFSKSKIKKTENLSGSPTGPGEPRHKLKTAFFPGLATRLNVLGFAFFDNFYRFYNFINPQVSVQPVVDGCLRFSNYSCNLSLFYGEDFRKDRPTVALIEDIERLSQRLDPYQVEWLIIPNKSSVYLDLPLDQQFWQMIEERGYGANWLQSFRKVSYLTTDLYAPNDTHLSKAGYQSLGQLLVNRARIQNAITH